ncbi:drug resistance transporter, EmrB/QacA subfamily [Pseudomonas sp. GM102]|uniref:MFS transporter n=1 Tax=Pseudomonas sp. GM102 TaxID=1144321 RepID=UPI00026F4B6C|nr:MFS transporter [Pseudomonas sp. GM102]EJM07267.1 drug resistance transporter, EmrB/QacA subfamily [Pseudomonas sp. GM102]
MPLSHRSKNNVALAAICLASLMFGLEISSVPVILPGLEAVLQADFKQMQWIMNAYTIACTTIMMATGTLADRFGRRRVFIISILAFGITSLICGVAQDVTVLIVSRFLQGLAGGAMLIAQVAILSHQFQEGRERSKAFGAWGIVFGMGLGFGPIIGGLIVAVSSWQWVFLIHVLIAIVTLFLVFVGVKESRDPQVRKLDTMGIVTLSLAVFGLAFYITQGPDLGFDSVQALVILAATVVSFALFLYAEKTHVHPMFDFSVFKIRNFSGALLGSIGMNFSFWPFMIYLPIYFQSGLGYDPVMAGLALLAYTLPTLVFPPVGERLALRYRPGIVIPCGLFTIGLGFMLMKFGSSLEQASWLTMLPGCLIAGIGLGITNTPVTNTTTGSVDSSRAGMASGIDMSARMISLAINIALMGLILSQAVYTQLKGQLPDTVDSAQVHLLAESIAAGNTVISPALSSVLPSAAIHDALTHGFGILMLYGGMGVWLLAAISIFIFASPKRLLVTN